jgi:hypothetical protein
LAALAQSGFMAVFDARQFRWQRLAAGTLALLIGRCLAVEFFLDGGHAFWLRSVLRSHAMRVAGGSSYLRRSGIAVCHSPVTIDRTGSLRKVSAAGQSLGAGLRLHFICT